MTWILLVIAAVLEVAGDALIRAGLKSSTYGWALLLAGAVVLVGYGFMVNLTKLDFGKLMGIYIVLFFLVSQVVAVTVFKEKVPTGMIVGGSLVVDGGLVMMAWRG